MTGTWSRNFGWMRVVLDALFLEDDASASRRASTDPADRDALRARLNAEALSDGRLGRIPEGDYGDNLLQAILALRVKFSRADAFEKLELNIRMREQRR